MPHLPSMPSMIAELVAIPSVSSPDPRFDQPNRGVVERIAEWAEGLGFRVRVEGLPGDSRKANLVATLGDGEGGLVLSGHTDTVPFDEGAWSSDPFEAVEKSGALYGLGTADMKGFFAAALEAARAFSADRLRHPLHLVATADEESTMNGARALVTGAGVGGAAHAVIGEPTGLRPVRLHKGILMERVRVEGKSGHSSDPSLGVSAIDAMVPVLEALLAYRDELAARHSDPRFAVPAPTLNLGRLAGGDSPNRICAACALDFDLRFTPALAIDELRASLRERIGACLADSRATAHFEPLVLGLPAFETPADAPIVRAAEALTGARAEAVMFATEGPFFTAMGAQTVVLGAGDIAVAHQPDEHVALAGIEAARDLYAKLIHRFCVEAA